MNMKLFPMAVFMLSISIITDSYGMEQQEKPSKPQPKILSRETQEYLETSQMQWQDPENQKTWDNLEKTHGFDSSSGMDRTIMFSIIAVTSGKK